MVKQHAERRFGQEPLWLEWMGFVLYEFHKLLRYHFAVRKTLRPICVSICCAFAPAVFASDALQPAPDNPVLARYDGGIVTLHGVEEFMREMPLEQRIPFARRAGDWRIQMAGELAKSIELTSQAKTLGMQLDPSFLRARDYFTMEYLSYSIFRDKLNNRMDVSLDAQRRQYETFKSDYWLSSTVSLRVIRVADQDKMTSAMTSLTNGVPFEKVELEFSEVSPRYRGRVVGPFPSEKDRTMIPPPDEVIEAAINTPMGQTTGPLKVGDNYFVSKTITITQGRQQTLDEVAERVEESLRAAQNAQFLPDLIDQIKKDLGVEVDEALFASATPKPDDLLATIGATRIYRQEYIDLNGQVRGPAAPIARMMPTRLKGFILPYMIGEWAKLNHYMERDETKKALQYYDIQHLSSRLGMNIGEQISPPPTDSELRKFFEANINSYRVKGKPEPVFEDVKDMIHDSLIQQRMPDVDKRVRMAVLQKIHFAPVADPVSINITALEALAVAGDKLPSDARLLEMGPARIPTDSTGATPYREIGRAPAWRITYAGSKGGVSEVVISGPAPLLESADDYTSVGAFRKWESIWRFDTDALKRHSIDKALGDFIAKHNNRVRAAATVEFSYSKDDPTSPTDCMIVYSATPADESVQDGVLMRYSAYDGEVTKRRLGEPEGKCPTCPIPDLPAPAILNNSATATSSNTTPTLNDKGDTGK